MAYDEVEVESIVLAVHNIEAAGLNSKSVLIASIVWLRENYERFQEIAYLEKAVCHIYAYLKLGYPYASGEAEFEKILTYLDQDPEDLFPVREWMYKKIPLTKAGVNRLLGKWNPRLHSMKIGEAVDDIIDKVSRKQEGEYIYHSGKLLEESNNKALWEKTYVLRIRVSESILQDVNKNQYYLFEEVE